MFLISVASLCKEIKKPFSVGKFYLLYNKNKMFVNTFEEFKKINPDKTEQDFTDYIELINDLYSVPMYRNIDKVKFELFKQDYRKTEQINVYGKKTEPELLDIFLERDIFD